MASYERARTEDAAPLAIRPRMLQLDFLRGVAILLVLGRHAPIHPNYSGRWFLISGLWARFGWTGVDLFFVLSGFLVGGLLIREINTHGALDVKRFLIRRALKIWPAYFVFLGFVFVVQLFELHGNVWHASASMLPNLVHVQNYFGTPRLHTWSLAVEEHFYLLLPLMFVWLLRWSNETPRLRRIPQVAVLLMIICTAWRCIDAVRLRPYDGVALLMPTHLRADSLFFGVLLAYYYHCDERFIQVAARHRRALFFAGLVLLAPMMVLREASSRFVPTVGVSMLYVGYGCILLSTVLTPLGEGWLGRFMSGRAGRAIAATGVWSYSIYLWHADPSYMIHVYLEGHTLGALGPSMRWFCAMAVYVAVACALGVVAGALVERPALMVRNRLFPSRALLGGVAAGVPRDAGTGPVRTDGLPHASNLESAAGSGVRS